jgi:homoserine kinase
MTSDASATVLAPATVGNVGPGFDVLGLAVDGLFDRVTVTLKAGASVPVVIRGPGADSIPKSPDVNGAAIAARAMLRSLGDSRGVAVVIDRELPLAGGLGGSAADAVGGALAAAHAFGKPVDIGLVLQAALEGEAAVAGRHLDNIAPCLHGGLCLVRSVDPADVIRLPMSPVAAAWQIALVTPAFEVATKAARAVLPEQVPRREFVTQMANTAALATAFSTGDRELVRRSLVDVFAEPRRASLIPGLAAAKSAAIASGALGCSISGAGPTLFAICDDARTAQAVAAAMRQAFSPTAARIHVGPIAKTGARLAAEAK